MKRAKSSGRVHLRKQRGGEKLAVQSGVGQVSRRGRREDGSHAAPGKQRAVVETEGDSWAPMRGLQSISGWVGEALPECLCSAATLSLFVC